MSTAQWLTLCAAAGTLSATLGFVAGVWWGRRSGAGRRGGRGAVERSGVPEPLRAAFGRDAAGLILVRIDRFERLVALHGDDAARLRDRVAGLLESGGGNALRLSDDTLALLPTDSASAAADRTRDAIRGHRFRLPDGAEVLVTCALGGTARGAGDTVVDLWTRASAASDIAAERGRNRIGWVDGGGGVAVR